MAACGCVHAVRRLVIAVLAIAAGAPSAPAAVVSQGAFRMGADALWSSGVDGAGQTVAIVDQGFGGLDASIAAGELPPREAMTVQSFDAEHGLDGTDDLGQATQHGTRMAEVVHDVAPGARLVLVSYGTVAEFARAADWVAAQGIPIVSHSNSFLDGPFDGTGFAARAVDRATAAGVLWVNSAGNFAQRHWEGPVPPGGAAVPFTVGPAGATLAIHLSWSDPAAQGTLAVQQQAADGTWATVFTGAPSGPVSRRVGPAPAGAGAWRAFVVQTAGPPATFTVFSRTVSFDLDPSQRASSVATPSDARGAVSVGAVPWTGDDAAPYSSQGPIDDGRPAPTLAAPTYVTANPSWPGTAGTSAATAHAAGAAALMRARMSPLGAPSRDALLQALVSAARDVGPAGPDALTGAGVVRVDTSAPSLRVVTTKRGRVLRLWAYDDATLASSRVSVDGRQVLAVRRARAGVSLARLRPGRHRIDVEATDLAGNIARRTLFLVRKAR